VEKFKAKYGYEPSPSTGGLAYDNALFAFAVIEEVLKRTGGVWDQHAKELVVDIVRKEHFAFKDGILMETYQEDPNDPPDLIVGEHYYIFPVIQYFDGKGKIIWPPAWAEAEFTPPPWFK
jgi:branched-chain amino acid transport system substrate-binding protein